MGDEQPPFPVAPEALAALDTLWSAGHAAYLVGGAVRDALLGIEPEEWDIATSARPERLLELFPGSTYENHFGTVLAGGMEITTFRRDHSYADHRHPERVTFSQDIFEDLARRDLTINAIAWGRRGPDEVGRLLDPADGRGDLAARLVRAVGDPGRRFDEDALRLLRAVRIAAQLGFEVEPMTRAAMLTHAGDVAWVSEERIGSELRLMLAEGRPSVAFRLMLETGILSVVIPELAALAALPRTAAAGAGSQGDRAMDGAAGTQLDHALACLDAAIASDGATERLALAALLHPIDPTTARTVLERLRISLREADVVGRLIGGLPDDYRPEWTDADVRRSMRAAGLDLLDDLVALREVHDRATGDDGARRRHGELRDRIEGQRAMGTPLTLGELAIDGADLRDTLGIPEGPTIGLLLDELLDDVTDEPALNRRATLLTRASLRLDELTEAGDGQRGARPDGSRAAP